jgi:hypothetical protein
MLRSSRISRMTASMSSSSKVTTVERSSSSDAVRGSGLRSLNSGTTTGIGGRE